MQERAKFKKLRFLYVVPCFFLFSSAIVIIRPSSSNKEFPSVHQRSRQLLDTGNESEECIPSGIHSFPEDFFTQEQRQKGGVIIHLLITFYVCAMIAIVCDVYFIPALEIISEKLKLPPDVAGATFMAIGASSPELFSSILGSFVTEGDIGVGAVIGSAVFNILGITGVAGVALWKEILDIDWYPMARDCIAYSITVFCLIWIISDNIIKWWEAVILLCIFLLYIVLMYFNKRVEKCSRNLAKRLYPHCCCCTCRESEEKTPLLEEKVFVPEIIKSREKPTLTAAVIASITVSDEGQIEQQNVESPSKYYDTDIVEEEAGPLCSPPTDRPLYFMWWFFMLPASFLFFITIPNCSKPKCRKFFPLTFIVSVVWLGVLSYLAVWMVTIIGYTLSIPDSVSGLTILAVGASVPDLVSTVLVAKSGQGNMAMSNLVGSNNFDISICLGVPWLAKTLLSDQGSLRIYSSALSYATASLLITLVIFYLIFQLSNWKLNRKVGIICLVVYALFLILACLFEFNVFGEINLPTCYP